MWKVKKISSDKGFTLIEMMAATVILVIAAFALFGFFSSMSLKSGAEVKKAQLNQEAKKALERITMELREAGADDIKLYRIDGASTVQVTDVYDELNTDTVATILSIEQLSGDPVWFRLDDIVDSNSLLRFKNIDSSIPSEYVYLINSQEDKRNVKTFQIRIDSNNNADNFTKYTLILELEEGIGNRKIEVHQETAISKLKVPTT